MCYCVVEGKGVMPVMNVNFPIKVGSLVEYVGHAKTYKGHVGVVTQVYSIAARADRPDSAMVHFPMLVGKGRDEACAGQVQNGLHPMAGAELEVIG